MAISLQFPNSKKPNEVTYATQRDNTNTSHYPNHSLGIKKHNCITKRRCGRNRTLFGCNEIRPVTRRNITDMPTIQYCGRGCEDISKCFEKINGKTCPNIKTKVFSGIPHPAVANLGQQFMGADYYDASCGINDMAQSKPPTCFADRKINRAKIAFQEHVNRMQNSKHRCSPECDGKYRVTYCDGSTDPMTQAYQCTQQTLTQQYPHKYICEPPMCRMVAATRSFGTCTVFNTESSPSKETSTSMHCKFSPVPSNVVPPTQKPGKNTVASCATNTCPILMVRNKNERGSVHTSQQQRLSNDAQTSSGLIVGSSQAKENVKSSERYPFSSLLPGTNERNCEDVPPGKNTSVSAQSENARKKSENTKRLEDYLSLDNANMSDNKEVSTVVADLDYEPYSNILNNILTHKSNDKKHDTNSIKSQNSYKSGKKRKKHKKRSKEKNGRAKSADTLSNGSLIKSTEKSLEINTMKIKTPSVLVDNEVSPTELYHEKKNDVKDNKDKTVEQDNITTNDLKKTRNQLSDILYEVVDEYVKQSNSNFYEQSVNKHNANEHNRNEDVILQSSPTNETRNHSVATNKSEQQAQIAAVITTYIDNVQDQNSSTAAGLSMSNVPIGYHTNDINNMLQLFYEKVKEKYSSPNKSATSGNTSATSIQTEEIEDYIEHMTATLLKIMKKKCEFYQKQNEEAIRMGRIAEAATNDELSSKTKVRIQAKLSGGSKPIKKICTKRKGLRQTFRDPHQRVCESLLKLNTDNSEFVEDHEYLQFSLRITEDIIRNDLYTNGQMKRVFKSHLEANRGRLDTQKMIDQINSLCTELNIALNEALPLENIASTVKCDDNFDEINVCCCKEQNGSMRANSNCMCHIEYYDKLMSQTVNRLKQSIENCDCRQDHCTKIKCPGMGYKDDFQMGLKPDFDFESEGILQTVMYSDTQCLGPRNNRDECNCVTINEMIRPTSSGTTGYIPSFINGNNNARRTIPKKQSEISGRKQYFNGKINKGKLMPGLRTRGMNRKDGESATSISNMDTTADSAPVRIKTPVTALRTQLGSDKPTNNFVVVECPVLVPTENPGTTNKINANSEIYNVDPPAKVKVQVKNSATKRTAEVIEKIKEDMKQIAYANEINETSSDPLVVPACNDCSCNADCKDVTGNLSNNITVESLEQSENSYDEELTQYTNQNRCSNNLDERQPIVNKQNIENVYLRTENNYSKPFATSGLKERLEQLTAVTLAISNNNMQSMLEKHPTYRPMKSCTTCHFNKNFIHPDESAKIFYPSKALNTVYSKCLFQQNNLLLGDEYTMFNPYSVRPETITHFFPTACTQVASNDLMIDSKSSLASDNSGVTSIVDSIIKASRDKSSNNSAIQILKIPPESLVEAIKKEIYKVTEADYRRDSDNVDQSNTSSKSKSTISSKKDICSVIIDNLDTSKILKSSEENQSTSFPRSKRESALSAVQEEDKIIRTISSNSHEAIIKIVNKSIQEENEKPRDGIREISITDKNSCVSIFAMQAKGSVPDKAVSKDNVDSEVQENINVVSIASDEAPDHKSKSTINIQESESEESSDISERSITTKSWMQKLDHVPSIKMTPSLKGSFDKAIHDTDKFRENYNTPDDKPIIAGMVKHRLSGISTITNISQKTKASRGSQISKRYI